MKNLNIKKRIAVGTFALFAGQAVTAITGTIILKIMTSNLGIDNYGIYATVFVFVSTFSLFTDLGLNAITSREVAKNPDRSSKIIGNNMGLRLFLSALMVPGIFALSYLFYPSAGHELRFGILLLSTYLFFDAVRSVSLAFFTAKIRSDVVAAINTFQQIVFLGLVAVVAILGWGMFAYLTVFIISNAVGALCALLSTRQHIDPLPRIDRGEWQKVLKLSASLGIIHIVNVVYLKADSILLSILDEPAAVGVYGVAYSLILAILSLPGFVMTALAPVVATATKEDVERIVRKAIQYIAILAFGMAAIAYVVSNDLIIIISTKEFSNAALPFTILAMGSVFSYFSTIFGYIGVALSKHHKMIFISLAALTVNIILNCILIPKYSITGAAVATFVSEALALTGLVYVFKRETKMKLNAGKFILKPLTAALLILPLGYTINSWLPVDNVIVKVLIIGFVMLALYFVALRMVRGFPAEILIPSGKILRRISSKP